uniref:28S ribosomal protein S35, mitochondrial n=1 Tax=Cacopsylla melanoneura TaxID=428564 RepID=A0A8D8QNG4_9HEMI
MNVSQLLKFSRCSPLHLNSSYFHSHSVRLQQVLDPSSSSLENENAQEEEFRVFVIPGHNSAQEKRQERRRQKFKVQPPRYLKMPVDQDWTNVWPGQRTFHPAVVPLPLRQGYDAKRVAPSKFANAELMKIPNFLHLTPPAIKKHCDAIKKFCTAWPQGLETEIQMEKHFPVTVITNDYCHSSPTIRDVKARIVTVKLKLSCMELDDHARDKFLRLVGPRYNPKTDELTIVTDRCPLRKQNYDYSMYVLTALFHESWTFEEWEKEKSVLDMEYYEWKQHPSYRSYLKIKAFPSNDTSKIEQDLDQDPVTNKYSKAVSDLFNQGEDPYTIARYKEATLEALLGQKTS